MSPVLYPRPSTTTLLLATLLSLSACGGGGGDDSPSPANPAPAPNTSNTSSKFADCVQTPAAGTVSFYLNTPRPRREWGTATYAGESLSARFDYASASATQATQIRYNRIDAVAKTSTLVAVETFDPTTGALTRREQYTGRTHSLALASGQSETVNYTVQTLFPAGVANRSERIVRSFEGETPVTLSQGQLNACAVVENRSSVAGSTVTRLSIEELYYVPGLAVVKNYFLDTNAAAPTAAGYRQASLVELERSTAPVSYQPSPAISSPPSLAACTAIRPNQALVFTANGSDYLSSYDDSLRLHQTGSLNGVATMASVRSNASTDTVSRIRHFDPAVGFLRPVGSEGVSNGTVTTRVLTSGTPDLRNTPVGQSVSYNVTAQTTLPSVGVPGAAPETFTFLGHQRISTVFGTRDTCKVKLDYPGEQSSSETYYYAPGLGWMRLETVLPSGQRVTRELVTEPAAPQGVATSKGIQGNL